ncbi:hypothetical protein [Mycobacterium celatum]|uniref:Uncharacterized protein n=1 Tax=Mycobacterium celatum TaxID=28045 RepID=A0A1X1RHJ2_MYCCE|nr:hypothetical protein [Mycobacterium celatum]ORV06409.1 hypothetical protein AWB95_22240 [Mycobacterium celatum]PIB78830.1 hypothetical protein CQY23_11790 [Mycobacterium celatum]
MADPYDKLHETREKSEAGLNAIFDDIHPNESPLAYGIKARVGDELIVGVLDGLVHALAELEKRSGG